MSAERKILICALIYWLGAVISYGHIHKQFRAEADARCALADGHCIDMARFDSVGAAFVWPMHWSEILWK